MAKGRRYSELKTMLEERRRELWNEVRGKIRDTSDNGSRERNNLDSAESSELGTQEDMDFALIQMKSETLKRIDDALFRLENGTYGHCSNCGKDIADRRLRALPFAVRCKDCEEARELAEERRRRSSVSPFTFLR